MAGIKLPDYHEPIYSIEEAKALSRKFIEKQSLILAENLRKNRARQERRLAHA